VTPARIAFGKRWRWAQLEDADGTPWAWVDQHGVHCGWCCDDESQSQAVWVHMVRSMEVERAG
jgi:hypothetical protein